MFIEIPEYYPSTEEKDNVVINTKCIVRITPYRNVYNIFFVDGTDMVIVREDARHLLDSLNIKYP